MFLSTEIFSKRRKIYTWIEEKPELVADRRIRIIELLLNTILKVVKKRCHDNELIIFILENVLARINAHFILFTFEL